MEQKTPEHFRQAIEVRKDNNSRWVCFCGWKTGWADQTELYQKAIEQEIDDHVVAKRGITYDMYLKGFR